MGVRRKQHWLRTGWALAFGLAATWGIGCGSTKSRTATEQLLMSDALDRAVAQIDFSELAGRTVFFDTKFVINTKDPMFIGNQKGLGFVNAEYVISSLRQQMTAAGLKLQDKIEEADYVVEARLGAIGFDNNEVLYGIPASNPVGVASTFVPNVPPVPAIPELAIAKKVLNVGAAKVGVFAYDRKTREAVWQAGISQAASDSRDTWVLGVGPFQRGSIYRGGTQFAGARLQVPDLTPLPPVDEELVKSDSHTPVDVKGGMGDPLQLFTESRTFRHSNGPDEMGAIRPAEFIQPAGEIRPLPPGSTTAPASPAPSVSAPATSTTAPPGALPGVAPAGNAKPPTGPASGPPATGAAPAPTTPAPSTPAPASPAPAPPAKPPGT